MDFNHIEEETNLKTSINHPGNCKSRRRGREETKGICNHFTNFEYWSIIKKLQLSQCLKKHEFVPVTVWLLQNNAKIPDKLKWWVNCLTLLLFFSDTFSTFRRDCILIISVIFPQSLARFDALLVIGRLRNNWDS